MISCRRNSAEQEERFRAGHTFANDLPFPCANTAAFLIVIDSAETTFDIRASMHTGTSISIRAPRERIFETVRDLTRWPEFLPHYRWVRFTGESSVHRVVEMAATRTGIPISWTSEYWTDEQQLELHFLHLKKWTKGMKVIWTLTPTRDGTRVEIVHDLKFRIRALAWLAEPIIDKIFIDHVAGRTLARFKEHFENGK